ncbi:hypothetical protein GNI_152930, partial [Gregarina niphandrodes]
MLSPVAVGGRSWVSVAVVLGSCFRFETAEEAMRRADSNVRLVGWWSSNPEAERRVLRSEWESALLFTVNSTGPNVCLPAVRCAVRHETLEMEPMALDALATDALGTGVRLRYRVPQAEVPMGAHGFWPHLHDWAWIARHGRWFELQTTDGSVPDLQGKLGKLVKDIIFLNAEPLHLRPSQCGIDLVLGVAREMLALYLQHDTVQAWLHDYEYDLMEDLIWASLCHPPQTGTDAPADTDSQDEKSNTDRPSDKDTPPPRSLPRWSLTEELVALLNRNRSPLQLLEELFDLGLEMQDALEVALIAVQKGAAETIELLRKRDSGRWCVEDISDYSARNTAEGPHSPEPLNPEPLNPAPLNPVPLNPVPCRPAPYRPASYRPASYPCVRGFYFHGLYYPHHIPVVDPHDSPSRGPDLPCRGPDLASRGPDLPSRGSDLPGRGSDLPGRGHGPDVPSRAPGLPSRGPDLPGHGPGPDLPSRGPALSSCGPSPNLPSRGPGPDLASRG